MLLSVIVSLALISSATGYYCLNYWTDYTWIPWSSCDRTCGGGMQVRTRYCSNLIDSQPCNQFCVNQGEFNSGHCQCKGGMTGYCCEVHPVCTPKCVNNATCVSNNRCQCLSGFYGDRCEIGSDIEEKMKPLLHSALPIDDFESELSWYDNSEYSSTNMVCFVKVHVQDAPIDVVLTATSALSSNTTHEFGNFTAGPIDSEARINSSSRFACLQVKCPGTKMTGHKFDVVVHVTLESASKRCHISNHVISLPNVTILPQGSRSDSLWFLLENGNNYGPNFGIYYGLDYLSTAMYLAQHECYSGLNFDLENMHPSKGVLANFLCI